MGGERSIGLRRVLGFVISPGLRSDRRARRIVGLPTSSPLGLALARPWQSNHPVKLLFDRGTLLFRDASRRHSTLGTLPGVVGCARGDVSGAGAFGVFVGGRAASAGCPAFGRACSPATAPVRFAVAAAPTVSAGGASGLETRGSTGHRGSTYRGRQNARGPGRNRYDADRVPVPGADSCVVGAMDGGVAAGLERAGRVLRGR